MIAAIGERTRALGKDNDLLFKIPKDLERFREITKGHPIIMGRKTWESLPPGRRPLPDRPNIVITRQADYQALGAILVPSMEEAIEKAKAAKGNDEIFIIGGGEIYTEGLPHAERLYLTLVDDDTEGDVRFPDYAQFTKIIEQEEHEHEGTKFKYITLEK